MGKLKTAIGDCQRSWSDTNTYSTLKMEISHRAKGDIESKMTDHFIVAKGPLRGMLRY